MCLLFPFGHLSRNCSSDSIYSRGTDATKGLPCHVKKTYSFTVGSWFMRSSGKASITCNWNILSLFSIYYIYIDLSLHNDEYFKNIALTIN
jgi:hypothetical protein